MMTKKVRTGVILSVVTGKLCCEFSDVHECIEHMAGGPIWTHQIPGWFDANREKLAAAFPDLANRDMSGLTPETAAEWMAERAPFLAEERDVPVIGGQPASPFVGLDPDKTIVVAVP
jgi:hypothetical protein